MTDFWEVNRPFKPVRTSLVMLTSFNEITCSIMAFLGLYGRKVIILQYDEKECNVDGHRPDDSNNDG